MDELLEPIIDYQMSDLESKAYKVGLLWIVYSRKYFPNYKHGKGYPKKGDPRKSSLFRFCFKLIRETQGLIPDNEYSLYVKAQLQILRNIQIGDTHPRIDPQVLAGDKAWIRWKVWKKKYDMQSKNTTSEDIGANIVSFAEIKKQLDSSRAFLCGKFEGTPKEEHIVMALAAHDIERWLSLEKLSPFYVILSPWIKKHCKSFSIDLSLYETSVTDEVKNYFKEVFVYELIDKA